MDQDKLANIEYTSLYREIDKHSDRLFIIINFDIVAVTTILGFVLHLNVEAMNAFGSHFPTAPLLLLLPLVIVLPSFVLVTAELNSIARVAAYIRVFYEERASSIAWQHTVQCIRKVKKVGPTQFLLRALRSLLPLLAIMCIILSVLSGIALSSERNDFSLLPYMLLMWIIALGLVAILTIRLGQTWHWENIDRLGKIVEESCIKT